MLPVVKRATQRGISPAVAAPDDTWHYIFAMLDYDIVSVVRMMASHHILYRRFKSIIRELHSGSLCSLREFKSLQRLKVLSAPITRINFDPVTQLYELPISLTSLEVTLPPMKYSSIHIIEEMCKLPNLLKLSVWPSIRVTNYDYPVVNLPPKLTHFKTSEQISLKELPQNIQVITMPEGTVRSSTLPPSLTELTVYDITKNVDYSHLTTLIIHMLSELDICPDLFNGDVPPNIMNYMMSESSLDSLTRERAAAFTTFRTLHSMVMPDKIVIDDNMLCDDFITLLDKFGPRPVMKVSNIRLDVLWKAQEDHQNIADVPIKWVISSMVDDIIHPNTYGFTGSTYDTALVTWPVNLVELNITCHHFNHFPSLMPNLQILTLGINGILGENTFDRTPNLRELRIDRNTLRKCVRVYHLRALETLHMQNVSTRRLPPNLREFSYEGNWEDIDAIKFPRISVRLTMPNVPQRALAPLRSTAKLVIDADWAPGERETAKAYIPQLV